MNTATRLSILLVVAGLAAGTFNVTNMAFADKPEEGDPDRNLWGKEAEQLARDTGDEDNDPGSEMGEHSREPGEPDLNEDDPGRVGVGNVDEELEEATGQEIEDHPSGVADFLCSGGSSCPEPNPAD